MTQYYIVTGRGRAYKKVGKGEFSNDADAVAWLQSLPMDGKVMALWCVNTKTGNKQISRRCAA